MAGADPNYPLRQNKFVDRRIFMEVLSRIGRGIRLDRHVYISMGGETMEDHRAVHSVLGLQNLVSFDEDQNAADRAHFNRPIPTAKCVKAKSTEIVDELQLSLVKWGFEADSPVIVWLDFTEPGRLGHQMTEFRNLLGQLSDGDIVRITLNANRDALGFPKVKAGKQEIDAEVTKHRFSVLKSRLAGYGSAVKIDSLANDSSYALTLSEALRAVADESFPPKVESMLYPASIVRYSDGTQMLTVTAVVGPRKSKSPAESMQLRDWDLYSPSWSAIHHIDIPHFTQRERSVIEHLGEVSAEKMYEKLGFVLRGDPNAMKKAVEEYRRLNRYFPNFQHVWH